MDWERKPNIQPERWQQLEQGELYRKTISDAIAQWLQQQKFCAERWLRVGALSADLSLDLALAQQIVLAEKNPQNSTALAPPPLFIQGSPAAQPFMDDFIDTALVALELNFHADPHAVLRETARVLKDDGYLLLISFNSFSPLLAKSNLSADKNFHISYRTFSPLRIQDWLKLLSLELLEQRNLPPNKQYLQPFAPLNLYIARKCTLPLTLQQEKVRVKIQQFFQPAEALKVK